MIDTGTLRYFIVVSDDVIAVSREVSDLMDRGWILHGPLAITKVTEATGVEKTYFIQAVERGVVSK